jgi:hypothetical protein
MPKIRADKVIRDESRLDLRVGMLKDGKRVYGVACCLCQSVGDSTALSIGVGGHLFYCDPCLASDNEYLE